MISLRAMTSFLGTLARVVWPAIRKTNVVQKMADSYQQLLKRRSALKVPVLKTMYRIIMRSRTLQKSVSSMHLKTLFWKSILPKTWKAWSSSNLSLPTSSRNSTMRNLSRGLAVSKNYVFLKLHKRQV